jgi:hypothetical protein
LISAFSDQFNRLVADIPKKRLTAHILLTMNIFTTLFLIGLSTASCLAQEVSLGWARQMGGLGASSCGNAITVDPSGNVITAGFFKSTVDFDPSGGIFDVLNLSSAGGSDIFISRVNSSGNNSWAIKMGAGSDDVANAVVTDASGNVYVTGYFQGTVDFDPSVSTANLVSAGAEDIFVARYTSAGVLSWARRLGGTGADIATGIVLDISGNVLVTGTFSGTGDFDPGAGTANLISAGSTDIFISKLSSTGTYVWARQMGGTLADGANGIESAGGDIYTTGYFQGSVDFDPGAGTNTLTSAGDKDVFISKLDASGLQVWTKQLGGTLEDIATGVQLDALGNVITSGSFQGTADFDPSVAVGAFTSAAGKDIFINKLDPSGNLIWTRQMGGSGDDVVLALEVDATDNIYTTGSFDGTGDFNPGGVSSVLSSLGGTDIFISKIDKFGNYVFGNQFAGLSSEKGTAIVVDASNKIYATGAFQLTVDFDPGSSLLGMLSLGAGDIFVINMAQTITTLPMALLTFEVEKKVNMVGLHWETATEKDNDYFSVERSTDGSEWLEILQVDGAGTTNQQRTYTTADEHPLPGIQYYRLKQVDWNGDALYSDIESVNFAMQSKDEIGIYPNPSTGKFRVFIPESNVKHATMRLHDFSGHTLLESNDVNGAVIEVDISTYPAGVFLLEMEIDGETTMKRVIKN